MRRFDPPADGSNNPPRGHSHRCHVFDVKIAFEQVGDPDGTAGVHFLKREYAYMVCMCGAVCKSPVLDNPNALEEAIDNGRDT